MTMMTKPRMNSESGRKAKLASKLLNAAGEYTGLSPKRISVAAGQFYYDQPYIHARMAVCMVLAENGWMLVTIAEAFRMSDGGIKHSIRKGRTITDPAFLDLLAHLRDIAASTP